MQVYRKTNSEQILLSSGNNCTFLLLGEMELTPFQRQQPKHVHELGIYALGPYTKRKICYTTYTSNTPPQTKGGPQKLSLKRTDAGLSSVPW